MQYCVTLRYAILAETCHATLCYMILVETCHVMLAEKCHVTLRYVILVETWCVHCKSLSDVVWRVPAKNITRMSSDLF